MKTFKCKALGFDLYQDFITQRVVAGQEACDAAYFFAEEFGWPSPYRLQVTEIGGDVVMFKITGIIDFHADRETNQVAEDFNYNLKFPAPKIAELADIVEPLVWEETNTSNGVWLHAKRGMMSFDIEQLSEHQFRVFCPRLAYKPQSDRPILDTLRQGQDFCHSELLLEIKKMVYTRST